MPGSIRAVRRLSDPVRGRGRIPLSKARTPGNPEFRPTGSPTVSRLEANIADTVMRAVDSIPHQTLLDSVESGDVAEYARRVLKSLTDSAADLEAALMEAFVASGETAAIELGQQLAKEYRRVGKAADVPLPSEVALQFRFDRTDPRAIEWIRQESSTLITNMVRSEQEAIRAIIDASFSAQETVQQTGRGVLGQLRTVNPSAGAREFADALGSNLNGLTARYETAVINRVNTVASDLAQRGVTGTKALEQMRKEGDKYAERLRKARSKTIARTERMRAHNQARLTTFQQAIDSGIASAEYSRKQWKTGPFDVCPICVAMQGQEQKVNDPFILPNGGAAMSPPGHPNCRCTMTMRTDTRLYTPPENLGTGTPGDPFRTTPRGFTPEGQAAAGRPIQPSTLTPRPPSPPTPPTTNQETLDLLSRAVSPPGLDDLPFDQRQALSFYRGSGFNQINGYARGRAWDGFKEPMLKKGQRLYPNNPKDQYRISKIKNMTDLFEEAGDGTLTVLRNSDETVEDFIRDVLRDLDDAASARVTEPLSVYRGRTEMLDLKPGDVIDDASFQSTSVRLDVAQKGQFSGGQVGDSVRPPGTVIRVDLQSGQRVVNIGGDWEGELLLPRNTRLRVVESYIDPKDGKRYVTAVVEETAPVPQFGTQAIPSTPLRIQIDDLLPKIEPLRDKGLDDLVVRNPDGSIKRTRPRPSSPTVNDARINGYDLTATDEAVAALDSVLEAGARAEKVLFDEVQRRTDDLTRRLRVLEEAGLDAERAEEAARDAWVAATRNATTSEIERIARAVPADVRPLVDEILSLGDTKFYSEASGELSDAAIKDFQRILSSLPDDDPLVDYIVRAIGRIDADVEDVAQHLARFNLTPNDFLTGNPPEELWYHMRTYIKNMDAPTRAGNALDDAGRLVVESRDAADITQLREEIANVRVEVLEEMLAQSRPGFGTGDLAGRFRAFLGRSPGSTGGKVTRQEVREAVNTLARRMPKEWVDNLLDGHEVGFVKRGFYSRAERKVRISGDTSRNPVGWSARSWQATLHHETQHAVQATQRAIRNLEHLLLATRAQRRAALLGPDYWKMQRIYKGLDEWFLDVGLGDKYMMKHYSGSLSSAAHDSYTELSTRGMERLWYEPLDDMHPDVLRLMLGILLLV